MTLSSFWHGLRRRVQASRLLDDAEIFRFPLRDPLRIALLEPGFRARSNMREFRSHELDCLRSYEPEALVAPIELAISLADMKRQGTFDLPGLNTAIVVVTSLGRRPLGPDDRELLWRMFEVPIFEQLRGWNGLIIGRECEIHSLHIDESAASIKLHMNELLVDQARTGWTAGIETGFCECGAETPRLLGVSALPPILAAAAA